MSQIPITLPPRLEVSEVDGVRMYHGPGNEWLWPSVTSILKATVPDDDRDALALWALDVGPVEAERIRAEASERGRLLHYEIEDWLPTRATDANGDFVIPAWSSPWMTSLSTVLQLVYEPVMVEASVWHDDMGYAGTVDLLARGSNGQLALIDWKTKSKRVAHRDHIRDYEIQVAAYVAALRRMHGLPIELGCVAIAYDDGGPGDVFWLDSARLRWAFNLFCQRVDRWLVRIVNR